MISLYKMLSDCSSEPVIESAVAFEIMLLISAEVPFSFLRVLPDRKMFPNK